MEEYTSDRCCNAQGLNPGVEEPIARCRRPAGGASRRDPPEGNPRWRRPAGGASRRDPPEGNPRWRRPAGGVLHGKWVRVVGTLRVPLPAEKKKLHFSEKMNKKTVFTFEHGGPNGPHTSGLR